MYFGGSARTQQVRLGEDAARTVVRTGPARLHGKKLKPHIRREPVRGAAVRDYDGDGRAEVVLRWWVEFDGNPTHVWVTDRGRDETAFTDEPFTRP
ncbi:hypothetical protein G5C51_12040 [Streptomyces sp. A7024]|uniref:VCBS repeat-containing protein n=1 Tax=Streptomyces coryli TaxID=1128680 RepID=A0A6G4TZS7_9ACTN|nr:hypothetical protein [Streptomyces coryli]